MNQREEKWDIFKGFAIFLVVWGHLIWEENYTVPATLIYVVHMPMFFVVSGYFAYYSFEKSSTTKIIGKKTKMLFLPWITWSALAVIMNCVRHFLISGVSISYVVEILKDVYCTPMSLWFLFALYVIFIIFGVSLSFGIFIQRRYVGLLLFVILVLLIPSTKIFVLHKIKSNAFWFLFGYLLHFVNIKTHIMQLAMRCSILFIPLYWVVFHFITVDDFFHYYNFEFGTMDIGKGIFVTVLSVFYTLLGLAFVWEYIVRLILHIKTQTMLFSDFGKNTMEIYTIHMMFVSYVVLVPNVVRQSYIFCQYVYMPIYAILICLVIKVLSEKVLHKIKIYNVLMLGKY